MRYYLMLNELESWRSRWLLPPKAEKELLDIFLRWSPTLTNHPGATSEAATQNRLRLNAPDYDGFLWRNNNGACVAIDAKTKEERHIRYGLGNDSKKLNEVFKSSDLIGVTPVFISPRHVGRTMGIFTAVECKKPDWHLVPSDKHGHAQLNFINTVCGCGGIGMFASHENHFQEGLKKWLD